MISADLGELINADVRLTLFARATVAAGIMETLSAPGPLIAFVPSDHAMVNEGSAFLLRDVLHAETNQVLLADLVLHHLSRASPVTLENADVIEPQTLANVPLHVAHVGSGLVIERYATVVERHVADNGVLYIVDRLLWPRDARWRAGDALGSGRQAASMLPNALTPMSRSFRDTVIDHGTRSSQRQ